MDTQVEVIPAIELCKRAFEHVTVPLSDEQRMRVIFFALGDVPIRAEQVREHLLGHLPTRTSPAEVCTCLREIRAKAPKQE